LRIAYLVNKYPAVSHTFIRREIHALERQGFDVLRVALRGWDHPLVDAEDIRERDRTHYVLKDGVSPLLFGLIRFMLGSRRSFFSAAVLAVRMGWGGDRPVPYHLAYLAEACQIVPWLAAHGARHVHAHFGTNSAEVAMLVSALGGPPYSFTSP
jgi:colanic acid/amylovoran biosynthesis glycosyltransferase